MKNTILTFFAKHPNETFKTMELARRLSLKTDAEIHTMKTALEVLEEEKRIRREKHGRLGQLDLPQLVQGKIEVTRQGFGFVTVEGIDNDVFIPPGFLGTALTGDTVEISLSAKGRSQEKSGKRREGEVLRVLTRGKEILVGTVQRYRKTFSVVPDDKKFPVEIVVDADELHGAEPGNKVLVQIHSWGGKRLNPEGTVIEVLGQAGEVKAELLSVAREFKLPLSFPPAIVAAAEALSTEIAEAEIARRIDFRKDICFTIDPEDAQDFDDAVSLDPLPGGDFRLGVHIADVSAYVTEGSELDKEAYDRGTSVYFPNMVIPMLPEKLSNVVCSLRPDEDRLTYSVFMTITPKGIVKDYEILESVIRSARRFTYEDVEAIVRGSGQPEGIPPVILERVRTMHTLSKTLTTNRMKEGSIDFESSEAKFRFDASGKPVEIIKKARLDSHRLVEEFMLLANKTVARHVGLLRKEDHIRPFLYRVHDSPNPDKVKELAAFVERLGFKLTLEGGVSSKAMQRLLEQVRGTEVENVINEVALRSMAKAVYSERNIGHYGLAFDYYSHFTSPIRRYPDLVVHRMLKEYARGMDKNRRELLLRGLPEIARYSSARERVAMEAERAAIKVMQVEYMKRHLGDEFEGVISGVTHFGMFVEIKDLLVEGMIHVRDLEGDYYLYDEKNYVLIGKRTGKRYRLGDSVPLKVVRVNAEEREIDFTIPQANGEDPPPPAQA
ncbi:MAG: ribonuclease R [Bacteroidota bacterium]